MQERQKKIKGSAIVDDEGLFVFTPYGTREGENRGFQLLKTHNFGILWAGKTHFSIRFRIPKEKMPSMTSLVRELIEFSYEMHKHLAQQKTKKGGRK